MSESMMDAAFLAQLQRKPVSHAERVQAGVDLDRALWMKRNAEEVLRRELDEETKRTWFYYGWQAAQAAERQGE